MLFLAQLVHLIWKRLQEVCRWCFRGAFRLRDDRASSNEKRRVLLKGNTILNGGLICKCVKSFEIVFPLYWFCFVASGSFKTY